MASGIYTAMAGAVAQSQALDTVANNISNSSTTGFRAERCRFGEALTRAKSQSTAYVQARGGATDTRPGPRTETGNPFDLALNGEGYFAIQTPQGTRLTRAGNFQLNEAGKLVTAEGNSVLGKNGKPIELGHDVAQLAGVQVTPDGSITAGTNVLGTIDIQQYKPTDVKREGNSLYVATGKPLVAPRPQISSGQLERGNFDVVRGMVDLVKVSRQYEALHRMLEGYRDMDDRMAKSGSGG